MTELTLSDWQDVKDHSMIKRINYKAVLGCSLTRFIIDHKDLSGDQLFSLIMLRLRDPENHAFLSGLNLDKVEQNLRTSISARLTELKIYGV